NRGIECAPDKRPGAELARHGVAVRHGIPDVGKPESDAEPADRKNRLAKQGNADAYDDGQYQHCERTDKNTEPAVAAAASGPHYCSLICFNCSSSIWMTFAGTDAYPIAGAIVCPSASAHFMK